MTEPPSAPIGTQAVIPEPKAFGMAGAFVAFLTALWLALHELSVLSSGFVLARGEPSSFNEMSGFGGWPRWEHWDDVFTGTQLENWRDLLTFYLLLDVVFVVTYTVALLRLLARISGVPRQGKVAVAVVVVGLAVVELFENAGQWWLGLQRDPAGDGVSEFLAGLVGWLTGLKWLLIVVLVLLAVGALIVSLINNGSVRMGAKEIASALWIQRFGLLVFLPIAALALLPLERLNNLFGQLPDVQRAWLDGWIGVWHFVAAGLVFSVVAYGIFALGRIRSDFAARRASGPDWPFRNSDGTPRRPNRKLWFAGPVLLVVLAIIVSFAGQFLSGAEVFWWRLATFCVPPLLVLGLSRVFQDVGEIRAAQRVPPPRSASWASTVMAVGDILAVTAVSVAGVAMVRAFTGVFALGRTGLLTYDYLVPPFVAVVFGFGLAVVPWLMAGPFLRALHQARPETDNAVAPPGWYPDWAQGAAANAASASPGVSRVLVPGYDTANGPGYDDDPKDVFRLGLLVMSVGVFLLLATIPRFFAYGLGALGAATLAVGALLGMLGVLVAYAQDRQPMQVFTALPGFTILPQIGIFPGWRFSGFMATPIAFVLVVAVLLSSLVSVALRAGQTEIHQVTGTGPIPTRPDLAAAFVSWLDQDDPCTVEYAAADDAFTIRPMLMLAAEGGGMRATYWTAATLQTISTAGDESGASAGCGARAALFSGGASGGALGLTIGRFTNRPRDLVEEMAGPDALAAGAVSLASGDLLASLAGIRFPVRASHRDPDWQGLDRAGLMEITWEREDELAPLRTEFIPSDPEDATAGYGSVTGQLILTTTEARNGCHALLSQVDVSEGQEFSGPRATCGQGAAGENSYDVLTAYGRASEGDGDSCLANPAALTAGLLASRFPYVTPSAVLGECRELEPTQLIDGGYSDNTGLGTVLGLSDTWAALVRDHNDSVLTEGSGELVVPMVVFIDNGDPDTYTRPSDAALAEKRPRQPPVWSESTPIPEILVPPIGGKNSKGHKVRARFALALAGDKAEASLCSDSVAGCAAFKLNPKVALQAFVVHQSNQPSMPAPLGWVLSESSQNDLDGDMTQQAMRGMVDLPNDPATKAGYASLHDLLVAMGLA